MDDEQEKPPAGDQTLEEGGVPELRAALAAAREEARQNLERWVRERADLENLKRRSVKERTDAVRYGIEALVRDVLPIVDNLERALEHAKGAGDGKALVDGVVLVQKSFLDALERHGVVRIDAPRGTRFDPNLHEAVAHVETADAEPNGVVDQLQPGYRLHDRLLRPALVTVAKAPGNLATGGGRD